ncbi:MAG TPA: L,D-transpeptidase family protein, partial [Chthoniobacterales bacterium]|nr:L,D-transpeptidase family protein [Chthoniobacterales bacterium]
ASNAHAYSRCIYIHGTPEERYIGRPASYGCIRMKSRDVADLYSKVPVGALVEVVADRLPHVPKAPRGAVFNPEVPKAEPKVEPETVDEEPEITAEKAPEKPSHTVRKMKEQPRFGRSA